MPLRWFTGKEWSDGTAERQFRSDYKEAVARLEEEMYDYDAIEHEP
jgi:hypothetical protein